MDRKNAGHILIVSVGGCALAAVLALFNTYTQPPHPSVPWLAWTMCACYAGVTALALSTFGRVPLPRGWRRMKAQAGAHKGPQGAPPATDARGQAAWDNLPVMAVPARGQDARGAVLAFARQQGMNAYEADNGYVLADAQGQFYRVTVG